MKINKIIGKTINEFATERNDLPDYFGITYGWPRKRVNGQFIAKKYNAIAEIVRETKATVKVLDNGIFIYYSNGEIKIDRDLLTDTFLLPLITNIN